MEGYGVIGFAIQSLSKQAGMGMNVRESMGVRSIEMSK